LFIYNCAEKIIEKGNSHELPNSIFVNLKSNTIMKKPQRKGTTFSNI